MRLSRALHRSLIGGLLAITSSASAATHALVVAGFGGDADYDQVFNQEARTIADALSELGSVNVLAAGDANRDSLAAAIRDLAASAETEDTAIVVMLGHGSYDSRNYRYHLRGPDPTGEDLADWLSSLRADSQLIVLATSASGAVFESLAADNRIVFTATKSGQEQITTVFGRYFAEGLTRNETDTDKNGAISADEAFAYVERSIEAHFEADRRLASEHALRSETEAPMRLARVATATDYDIGTRTALEALEDEVVALRAVKDSMAPGDYLEKLQELLIEIAILEAEAEAQP